MAVIDFNLTPPPQTDDIYALQQWFNSVYTQLVTAFAAVNAELSASSALLAGVPIGAIIPFAADALPPGAWLWCDGSDVSRDTYATLFAVLGETWGAGNGSTTFTLPDLRDRTFVFKGDMGGIDAARVTDESEGDDNTLAVGNSGGEDSHVLLASELPDAEINTQLEHAPGIVIEHESAQVAGASDRYVVAIALQNSIVLENRKLQTFPLGDDDPHNNMPPYTVPTAIIRYA